MTDAEKPNQAENTPLPEQASQEKTEHVAIEPQSQVPSFQSQNVQPQVVKSGGKGLSVVAILLSLMALAGTGYTIYKDEILGRDADAELAVDIAEIGGMVSRIGDSVARLQAQQSSVVSTEQLTTRLLEASNSADLRFRDVEQGQVALTDSLAKLNRDMSGGVNDFIVSEVAQLLKMANNSALFSSDTSSAIKALQLADLQLKELADPSYAIVRRKINEEIASLESIQTVDIAGLTVKLKALAERIPSLKLENEVPVLGEVEIEVEQSEGPKSTAAHLRELWADIVRLGSVQRIDQAPKPLLVPEQRYFLNQNIQLQLAKAELGLVQNRTSVYSQSLEEATNWLDEYFDTRDQQVVEVIQQINSLKAVSLGQELPNISGSYSELQSIRGGQ